MQALDYGILAVLFTAVFFAARYSWRHRGSCGGCSGCEGCAKKGACNNCDKHTLSK